MTRTALIKDVYPEGEIGDGIFTDLQNLDVPWKDEQISSELDIIYYSKSGYKICSDLVVNRLNDRGYLTDLARATIATATFCYFKYQWSKLYETLFFEYDPIENYRMVETEEATAHSENEDTHTGTITRDASNTSTDTGTISDNGSETLNNTVYGFNSSTAVNSDGSSDSNTNTQTRNLNNSLTVDDSETRNLADSNETDSTTERELTRSGNIGVTTSQQMIDSERSLWRWNFFSTVFKDIDSVLCLDIYNYDDMED